MKIIYLSILFCITLFSASIDTKLYDEKDREAYHEEIRKEIELAYNKNLRSKDIIKDETTQLSRVRDAISQKVQIQQYDLKEFNNKTITSNQLYDALIAISILQTKQEDNYKIIDDIQSKLLFLKQSIERITEDEKPKLLSYQLQFAYYKIQQKNIELKITLFKDDEQRIYNTILKIFKKLKCQAEKNFQEKLNQIDKEIQTNTKEKISKELQREKALILEDNSVDTITKAIDSLSMNYQDIINNSVATRIEQSLCILKQKDSEEFYKSISDTQDIIRELSDISQKNLFIKQLTIIKNISKNELGKTKLFFGATAQESKAIALDIKEFVTSPLFVFNEKSISLFSILKAMLYLVFGFVLGMIYKRWILRISNRWKDISMMSVRLASNVGYYLIILIFLIIAISSLGIDMSSISLIAGALSIGIGFGLQTVVSNLIAGIILMLERTIRIGDTIEVNDVAFGTVTDMRIRSTTIKTFDNIDIVIPNSSFIQNNVVNWTLDDRIRRIHIPFSVAYGTEVKDVRDSVLGALAKSELFYIHNNEDKKPDIRMTMMNSSSVDFELIVWVYWDIKLKKISLQSDFLILIYDALRQSNISIPFPQLDVYIKQKIDETKIVSEV